jgi:hypothetical protein
MSKLGIRGIVREAQRFRQAFTVPLTAAEQHALHARLNKTLADIDASLARGRVSPARLTGPSRLAYNYLKKLQVSAAGLGRVSKLEASAPSTDRSRPAALHSAASRPVHTRPESSTARSAEADMPAEAQLLLWPEAARVLPARPPLPAPPARTEAAESLAARATRQRVRVRPPESVTFRGLRGFLDRLLDRTAASLEAGRLDRSSVQRAVNGTCDELETTLADRQIRAEHLRGESRELLGWFRYFSRPGNLDHYYVAVDRAQVLWGGLHSTRLRWRTPLLVHLRPSKYLYRWRVLPGGTRIVLNTPMVAAGDAVLRALARQMAGGGSDPAVLEAMLSPPYQTLTRELERLAGKVEQTRGLTCDLVEVFDAINREYFAGRLPRPKLLWSRNLTGHKFGHYDYVRDTVMISSSLDSPDVPALVVRHVMHHELLHKKHGFQWRGGRRQSHTPAFRTEEHAFPEYAAADQFLRRFGR